MEMISSFNVAGRLVQPQDYPSQALATPLAFRVVDPNRLLEDLAGVTTPDRPQSLMGLNGIVDECQRTKKDASVLMIRNRKVRTQKLRSMIRKLSRLDRHLIEQRPVPAYERSPQESSREPGH